MTFDPRLVLDGRSAPSATLHLRFLQALATQKPHCIKLEADPSGTPAEILPSGSTIDATWKAEYDVSLLGTVDACMVYVSTVFDRTFVYVAGPTPAAAEEVAARLRTERDSPDPRTTEYRVWRWAGHSSHSYRRLPAGAWEQVQHNYTPAVRSRLAPLMTRAHPPEEGEGRLILFHGDPGTGKTNAVRALAQAWAPWCEPQLVTDPEYMFANADYLIDVLKSVDRVPHRGLDTTPASPKWKLIIAEDADVYLRSSARQEAGMALGRLLNATDGILGQASRAVVLLTTNEPLGRLHPAITRPGRCLASLRFETFTGEEANTWLGGPAPLSTEARLSLADLYCLRRGGTVDNAPLSTGTYL